jgi:hypothetical protein
MDNKIRGNRNAYWSRFKLIKSEMTINLSYMQLVLKGLDSIKDTRLNSNKLKTKKQWLKRLF